MDGPPLMRSNVAGSSQVSSSSSRSPSSQGLSDRRRGRRRLDPEVAERLQVGEDLLTIGDATWSIHWLYAMHHDLNSEGPTDLTAHWRDVESGWQSELNGSASFEDRGALDEVRSILVAPGVMPRLHWGGMR